MNKRLISIALVLFVCLTLTLGIAPGVSAADTVGMAIDPTPKEVGINETFTVDIVVTITAGENVDTAGAYINFNTTYLEVLNITAGTTFTVPLGSGLDNGLGTINYAAGAPGGSTANSTFVLATIEFKSKDVTGTTPLTFVYEWPLRNTKAVFAGIDILDHGAVTGGNVTVSAAPPPTYTITFDTVPASTGNITFAGVSYSDGGSINKSAATYNIVAVPGAGYYFDSWVTIGSLSVASATSNTTTCNVTGAGTLRMVQNATAPPPTYTITFDTVPASTGNITFAGVSYSDGNTVTKTAGIYTITANPVSGYYFDSWVTTGLVSVASSTSATTTCTVSGNGTLRMVLTTTPPPVGGTAYPPDKLLILLPWIAIGAAIIVATSLLVRRRRSATR